MGLIAAALATGVPRLTRFRLRRRHMAWLGAAVLLERLAELAWRGGRPVFCDFLAVFGPVLALWILSRRWDVWERALRRGWAPWPVLALRRCGGRWAAAAVILAIVSMYAFSASRSTLWDRDEPRFSRAAVEMVESGNYLYPTFLGKLRPDKPILIYWLMSVPLRLFGLSEWALRLTAVMGAAAAMALTWRLGRKWWGPRAGLLAAAALGTSPLLMVSGTAATTDAVLLAWILGALSGWESLRGGGRALPAAAVMALCLGGALLTKGPVGLAVPLLAVGGAELLARAPGWPRRAGWVLAAAAVGTLLFLAWAIPANIATGGEFYSKGVGQHVVSRSLRPMESHGGREWAYMLYYLPVVLLAFFPWTIRLPGAVAAMARDGRRASGFVAGWAGTCLGLMSVVATKLPHYVLPAWPALALAVAREDYPAASAAALPGAGRRLRRGVWLFAPVGVLAGTGLILAPWRLSMPGIEVPAAGLGILLLGMTAFAASRHMHGRHGGVAAILVAGMMLVQGAGSLFLLPALEDYKMAPRVATVVKRSLRPGHPVFVYRFEEPSLFFYLDELPFRVLRADDEAAAWISGAPEGLLVLPRPDLARLRSREDFRLGRIRTVDTVRGFNYSNGRWLDVCIVRHQLRGRHRLRDG